MDISLCMIVKNEEDTIARCINSVKDIVDEIIIVDTGSTDNTLKILKNLNIVPYRFEWINDFSAARNFSFSKATKDYILWLDADDVLNPDDIELFKNLKNTLTPDIDAVSMNYVLTTNEQGEVIHSMRRNRLVKNSRKFKWVGFIHEYLEVYGNVIHSNISIIHKKIKAYSNRNLLIYQNLIEKGHCLSPRDEFYYANELYDNEKYDEAIIQYEKFLSTNQGWIEDIKYALYKIADCYLYKNDRENEINTLFRAFKYDTPRSDFCCRLGSIFFENNNLDAAIFWYNCALEVAPNENYMGILSKDTYTFIPWVQLCVCYYKKGDINKSYLCNEKAALYHPNHPAVLYNKEFFSNTIQ